MMTLVIFVFSMNLSTMHQTIPPARNGRPIVGTSSNQMKRPQTGTGNSLTCILWTCNIHGIYNNIWSIHTRVRLNENATDPDVINPLFVRGDDAWVGHTVTKEFGGYGKFKGRVTDVDDNEKKSGSRVFHVEYEDDDDEWMGAEDLLRILDVSKLEE